MRFEIVLAPSAVVELRELPAGIRSRVRMAIEQHLRHEPTKLSRSGIKRLRGLRRPQYRLRVDDTRVLYDVTETTVEVLAIIAKREAARWLAEAGSPATPGSSGQGEG